LKPHEVFSVILLEKADGAGAHTLEGPRILPGRVVLLETFYVGDLTTVNRQLRLGFNAVGNTYWLKRARAGASAFTIAQDGKLILVENERPYGYVEDAANGDDLILVARGTYL